MHVQISTRALMVLVAMVAFSARMASAQETQDMASSAVARGGVVLSGRLAFNSAGGDLYGNNRVTTIGLEPVVGYLVQSGFMIGGEVDYTYLSVSEGIDDIRTLAIGPRFAGYFANDSRVVPVLHGSVLLLNIGASGQSESGLGVKVGAGLELLATESLGFGLDVSYLWERFTPSSNSDAITGNTLLVGITSTGFLHWGQR